MFSLLSILFPYGTKTLVSMASWKLCKCLQGLPRLLRKDLYFSNYFKRYCARPIWYTETNLKVLRRGIHRILQISIHLFSYLLRLLQKLECVNDSALLEFINWRWNNPESCQSFFYHINLLEKWVIHVGGEVTKKFLN